MNGIVKPSVTAVMITGKDVARYALARLAMQCFKEQVYPNKDLLIINHGPESLHVPDPQIRELRITRKPGQTLGDLRNIGLQFARGDFIMNWDDDDWHHPLRMHTQVALQRGNAAVFLKRQIRYSFLNKSAFMIEVPEGIHGTILHPRKVPFQYRSLNQGEDTAFMNEFKQRQVLENDPTLYIRFYHGANVCSAAHIMKEFADPLMKPKIRLSEARRAFLQEIISKYSKPVPNSDDNF